MRYFENTITILKSEIQWFEKTDFSPESLRENSRIALWGPCGSYFADVRIVRGNQLECEVVVPENYQAAIQDIKGTIGVYMKEFSPDFSDFSNGIAPQDTIPKVEQ